MIFATIIVASLLRNFLFSESEKGKMRRTCAKLAAAEKPSCVAGVLLLCCYCVASALLVCRQDAANLRQARCSGEALVCCWCVASVLLLCC